MNSDDLNSRFERLSPVKRALFEKRRFELRLKDSPSPSISRRTERQFAPLSFAQQRLWFLNQLEPESPTYRTTKVLRLTGSLNVKALERSLNQVIARHESLRTTIVVIDNMPLQRIADHRTVELPVADLTGISDHDRAAEAQRLITETTRLPFDFSKDFALRTMLLKLGDLEHILVIVNHYIAVDGWSSEIFWREFETFFNALNSGQAVTLPELPIQYADFAVWQREWLQGPVLDRQLSYWQKHLSNLSPVELPTDRARPDSLNPLAAVRLFSLSSEVSAALKSLSREEGSTLFMTLLAAFQTLLSRYTAEKNVAVGTPIAGRNREEIKDLIGSFANTLVLRTNFADNPTVRELLKRVNGVCLDAYSHQDLPFEKLVEELQPERSLNHNPLFQIIFQLNNSPRKPLSLEGLRVEEIELNVAVSKLDLTLSMFDNGSTLSGRFTYNTDLFDPSTIERMVGHFQVLLEGIVANPDLRLSELPLLSATEKQQLLLDWNDSAREYPQDTSIPELFEEQVEKTPDAIAIIFEGQQLSYRELNTRANRLAHYLQKLGVGPEVIVAVCIERSIEMVIGLLGILKTGGAYMPIDPEFPRGRIAFMLHDSETEFLLTQSQCAERIASFVGQRILLDRDSQEIALESSTNPRPQQAAHNLAYVTYTSGSTGHPKGVMINHKAVVNCLASMAHEPGLSETDTLLAVTTYSFDIAALEIFLPLTLGARVVLAAREFSVDGVGLAKLARDCHATVMQATPATWQMLLAGGWQGSRGLKILCGGEALSKDLARQLVNCGASLWNLYGPTETTIWSSVQRVSADFTCVTLGHPIANTQMYILDSDLNPVPIGVKGELHIGGDGLARGYINRSELTAEKFITNPFSRDPQSRLYKTGDLARYLPAGNIEFLGRCDDQVKIRGYRIELGEIEMALMEHPSVRQAVALAREDSPGEKRLVVYVVSHDAMPRTEVLHDCLTLKLPDYMVPSAFVFLDEMPLTANGKLDRKALPAPDQIRSDIADGFAAPQTPTEEILANVWAEALNLDRVGIHDNFFHLGGHSLLATKVVSRVNQSLQINLPLRRLFESPTIAGLADSIQASKGEDNSRPLPVIVSVPRSNDMPLAKTDYLKDKCIHQLFEEQVERTPEAIAVVFDNQQLTYRELNNRANPLAHYLRKLGVGPEVLVGLCFEPSIEMIVGLLAVLKAGGAYVPLDPGYPADRLRFMLRDTQTALLLTQDKLLSTVVKAINEERTDSQIQSPKSKIQNVPASDPSIQNPKAQIQNPTVVVVDRDWPKIAVEPTVNPKGEVIPDNLSYVIYTSGSTGTPKGTLVTHYNVVRLFQATERWFGFNSSDTWTLFHSYAFDFSVWEMCGALLYGGRLVIVPKVTARSPEEFTRLLIKHNVTVLNQTPSAFRQLMPVLTAAGCRTLTSLRYVIFGGEALQPAVLTPWFERYAGDTPKVINMYGITETTVHATCRQVTRADAVSAFGTAIGKPLPDLQVYLLDQHRGLVPVGVPGEIYVGGAGLARGYLNRPELTAEKFVDLSLAEELPQRFYRSGDLARYLPDGDLEFLGRIDEQVKIRGYRIELGEIEATLAQHPAVRDCAVIAYEEQIDDSDIPKPVLSTVEASKIENPKSDPRLVAYIVTKGKRCPSAELRDFLAKKLPDYMVPSAFVFLDALPLTTNGKLDRSALPMPQQFRVDVGGDFAAPRNATEEILANIFAEALEIDRVGIHDNFFDLGGHSLLAAQVVSRICSAFNADLALRTFFEKPTVVALADSVQPSALPVEALLPISHGDNIPLSFAQERLWFLDQFNPNSATYNVPNAVRLTGDLDVSALEQSFNEMIRRHQSLRTVFPSTRGRPAQTILPAVTLTLSTISLDEYSEAEREAVLATQLEEQARRPFDLANGPLIRAQLWRLAAHDYVLLLNLHHIVCDGWSMSVLWRELSALYRGYHAGEPACLPELPIQYADYAVWQRDHLRGETLDEQVSYWKTKLAGLTPLQLPTDYPRPAVQTDRGGSVTVNLSVQLCSAIKSFSQRENVTLFMTLLATFQALLCRYTGQVDIAVGTPIAGRTRQETEGLIGFFVNTLVLRADLSGNPTFRELIKQMRDTTLDAYTHQDLPFEKLVHELQPERNTGISPLFQSMFVLQDPDRVAPKLEGLTVERIGRSSLTPKFDLSLTITQQEGAARAALNYNADLFERATIERLLWDFQILLQEIVNEPNIRIADLDLPTDEAKKPAGYNSARTKVESA